MQISGHALDTKVNQFIEQHAILRKNDLVYHLLQALLHKDLKY